MHGFYTAFDKPSQFTGAGRNDHLHLIPACIAPMDEGNEAKNPYNMSAGIDRAKRRRYTKSSKCKSS
jgi:hypothetical protein